MLKTHHEHRATLFSRIVPVARIKPHNRGYPLIRPIKIAACAAIGPAVEAIDLHLHISAELYENPAGISLEIGLLGTP